MTQPTANKHITTLHGDIHALRRALRDLLEVVELSNGLDNDDLEPYKWEDIVDDAIRNGQRALEETQ